MKILILLGLLGFVAAGIYQQPLTRVESRKSKMINDGTWDAYYKKKELLQYFFNSSSSKNLKDFDELEYIATIYIGTPPQAFKVHYDLSSFDLWIPDITCGNLDSRTPYCPNFCTKPGGEIFCNPKCKPGTTSTTTSASSKEICDQKSKFDLKNSTTFSPSEFSSNVTREYEFTYISTSYIGQDKIEANNEKFDFLTVPLCGFSQTIEFSPAFAETPINGILGFYSGEFVEALRNTKALDKELFTIYLQKTNFYAIGGSITFGGIDEEHCSSEVIYEPRKAYELFVRNITYGSMVVQEMATAYLDMSRTSIYGPADSIAKIKEAVGAREDGMINCDAQIEDITFGDETDKNVFTIPAKNLIIKNLDGSCNLAVAAMPLLGSSYQSSNWIFGTPWFYSYCNVFTFGINDEKVGIAKIIA